MSQSEVARTREQVNLQIEAANRALHDPAVVASHLSITARMERMAHHVQALQDAGLHAQARQVCEFDDLWT